MQTADFDFDLPDELIAQAPAPVRDQSRLLVLDRATSNISHKRFSDVVGFFSPGDVLVLNNSRVIPARLCGVNAKTNGKFEALLLEENSVNDWWAMLRPGKRARIGTEIIFLDASANQTQIKARVAEINSEGHRRLVFSGVTNISNELKTIGRPPLPPYIERKVSLTDSLDCERYQTVFAQPPGSVAAPTAGLHFTEALLEKIRGHGVKISFVTLHVGPGTFLPVKTESIEAHLMHEERFEISDETALCVNEAKRDGHRIIAVGTTSVRVLESVAAKNKGRLVATTGRTRIFIYPPYEFNIVDALVTNFHLPRSTLLMLVSAFAAPGTIRGRETILGAYTEAIRQRYRFFSYGDAMLIL